MWMYPGTSSSSRPFSVELDGKEIDTWIRGVHAQEADQNFVSGPVP
jgi:hypothetical protein